MNPKNDPSLRMYEKIRVPPPPWGEGEGVEGVWSGMGYDVTMDNFGGHRQTGLFLGVISKPSRAFS